MTAFRIGFSNGIRRSDLADDAFTARCPTCGSVHHSTAYRRGQRRNAYAQHVNVAHAGLSDRERALVADTMLLFEFPPSGAES